MRFGRNGLSPTGRKAVAQAMKRQPEGFGPRFDVEGYLEAQAERFVKVFDPNCYLYLSRASDQFDLAEHGEGSVDAAFARFQVKRTLVLGVQSDMLYTIDQQQQIVDALRVAGREVEFHAFPSPQGHDAFLVDYARFEPTIGNFLRKLP